MLIDDLYEQVFNASPFGMAIIDRNHRVLRTNPAMDRINGRQAEPGEPGAHVTPHIADTVRAYVDTVFQTKIAPEPVRLKGRTEGRDGGVSEWHCAFTPIAGETGARVELCLAVITDLGAVEAAGERARELEADTVDIAAAFADNVVPHPAVLTKDEA
ncbi:MAG: PAS domain-containing protein [Oceanicaulis sp.]